MSTVRVSYLFFQRCIFLTFIIAFVKAEECDRTTCHGPIKYYESLGCTPVYKNPGDCCPVRYDCDHLKQRSTSKCYVNGQEYEIGESLKEEHSNKCDFSCKCLDIDGVASFMCAGYDCALIGPPNSSCYFRTGPGECCPDQQPYCPPNPDDIPMCEVDGKIYKDGENFQVKSEPNKICSCMAGYKGETVEPFCIPLNRSLCAPDFASAGQIHRNCAPVFYNLPIETSCSGHFQCPDSEDIITEKNSPLASEDLKCTYGNRLLNIGDEVQTTYQCIKCVCNLPPALTCWSIPFNQCYQTVSIKTDG